MARASGKFLNMFKGGIPNIITIIHPDQGDPATGIVSRRRCQTYVFTAEQE